MIEPGSSWALFEVGGRGDRSDEKAFGKKSDHGTALFRSGTPRKNVPDPD